MSRSPFAPTPRWRPGLRSSAPRPRVLASGVVLALALAASGCGGEDEPAATTAAATGGQGAGTSTTPAAGATTTAAERPAAAPEQRALASRAGTIDDDAVSVDVVGLERSGPTVVLNLRLRVTAPDPEGRASAQISQTFANDVDEKTPGGDPILSDNADGLELVDTKNRKRHLVARDSENRCVCSSRLNATFVSPAAPVNVSATFGAPPADVRAMDVTIPGFGTLTDVPLS